MLNDKSGQLEEKKHRQLAQHLIPPPNYTHQITTTTRETKHTLQEHTYRLLFFAHYFEVKWGGIICLVPTPAPTVPHSVTLKVNNDYSDSLEEQPATLLNMCYGLC